MVVTLVDAEVVVVAMMKDVKVPTTPLFGMLLKPPDDAAAVVVKVASEDVAVLPAVSVARTL